MDKTQYFKFEFTNIKSRGVYIGPPVVSESVNLMSSFRQKIMWLENLTVEGKHIRPGTVYSGDHQAHEFRFEQSDNTIRFKMNLAVLTWPDINSGAHLGIPGEMEFEEEYRWPLGQDSNVSTLHIRQVPRKRADIHGTYLEVEVNIHDNSLSDFVIPVEDIESDKHNHYLAHDLPRIKKFVGLSRNNYVLDLSPFFRLSPEHARIREKRQGNVLGLIESFIAPDDKAILISVRRIDSLILCLDIGTSSMTVQLAERDQDDRAKPLTLVNCAPNLDALEDDLAQLPVKLMPFKFDGGQDSGSMFPVVSKEAMRDVNHDISEWVEVCVPQIGREEKQSLILTNIKNYFRVGLHNQFKVRRAKVDYRIPDKTIEFLPAKIKDDLILAKGKPVIDRDNIKGEVLAHQAYKTLLQLQSDTQLNDIATVLNPQKSVEQSLEGLNTQYGHHSLQEIAHKRNRITDILFAVPNGYIAGETAQFFHQVATEIVDKFDLISVELPPESKARDELLLSESKAVLLNEVTAETTYLQDKLAMPGSKYDTLVFDIGAGTADISLARITSPSAGRLHVSVLSNGSSDLAGNFFDILVAETMFQSALNRNLDYSGTISSAFDAADKCGEEKLQNDVPLRSDFSNLTADYMLLSIFARLLNQDFPQEVGNIQLQPRTTEHLSNTQYYNSALSLGLFTTLTQEKHKSLTGVDGITETDLSDLNQKLLSYRNSQVKCLSEAIQRFNANQSFEIQSYSVTVRYTAAEAHFGEFIVEYNPQVWNSKQPLAAFSPTEVTKAFTNYSGLKDFERSNLSEAINLVNDNTKLLFRETENNSLADKESPIEYIVKGYVGATLTGTQKLMTVLKSLAEELKKNGRTLKESIDKLESDENILIPNELRKNYDINKMLDVKIKMPLGRASLKNVEEKSLAEWIDIVGIRQIEQMIDKVNITLKETDEAAFELDWMILTGRGSKWGRLKESLRAYCAQNNIKPSGELGRVDENYAKYAVVNGMGYHKYWSQVDEKEGNVIENATLMTQPYYYAVLRAGGNSVQSLIRLDVPDGEKWHTEDFSRGELEIFTTFESYNYLVESEEAFYHRCVKSRVMKRVGEVNKKINIDICKESDGSLTIYYHDKNVFEGSRDFEVEPTMALRLAHWPNSFGIK